MKRINSLEQISRIMLLAILPSLVVYVIILYLSISDGIDPILVLRDPIQSCDYPTVVGMIDKLAKKNIIHNNKAANLKSKLMTQVAAM